MAGTGIDRKVANVFGGSAFVWDVTNSDNEERPMFKIEDYVDPNEYIGRYDDFLKVCEEKELDEIDIDPIYMFVGVSTGENPDADEFSDSASTAGTYLLKKIDRAIFQREDGCISRAVWKNPDFAIGNPNTDTLMRGLENGEYYNVKLIEELEFIQRTYTDRVTLVGDAVPNLAIYGNICYDKIVGHGVILVPCGEDDNVYYCYVLFAGNILLDRDEGIESGYGTFLLTTVDGNPILQRIKKIESTSAEVREQ